MKKRTKTPEPVISISEQDYLASLLVALVKHAAPTLDEEMAFVQMQLLLEDGISPQSVDHYGYQLSRCLVVGRTGSLGTH